MGPKSPQEAGLAPQFDLKDVVPLRCSNIDAVSQSKQHTFMMLCPNPLLFVSVLAPTWWLHRMLRPTLTAGAQANQVLFDHHLPVHVQSWPAALA